MQFSKAFIGLIFCTSLVFANQYQNKHYPLELSDAEYRQLWQKHQQKTTIALTNDDEVLQAIRGGEKLAQWIALVNSEREEDDKIYLTSAQTRHGIPIDRPNIYGPAQIKSDLHALKSHLPEAITEVVYGQAPISGQLPIAKQQFIQYGRQINRLYQTAVRWEAVIKPNKEWYLKQKQRDVRGYYHLNNIKKLDDYLGKFDQLSTPEQEKLKNSLILLCLNAHQKQKDCSEELSKRDSGSRLVQFKNKYWQQAKDNWQGFFEIRNPRNDVTWTHSVTQMPFQNPESNRLQYWLKTNVEEEFQWSNWRFQLNFVDNARAHLKFEPNITPHVTQGNIIVMDKTTDIDEYEVQWTIRHEYGHILRLPDCYVEFYDERIGAAVNYQLDIDDLMCSRAGNMNARIYQELKRVYGNLQEEKKLARMTNSK